MDGHPLTQKSEWVFQNRENPKKLDSDCDCDSDIDYDYDMILSVSIRKVRSHTANDSFLIVK